MENLFPGSQQQTLLTTLGIRITEATKDRETGTMPVGPAVHQQWGLLHGGVSVALAETVASTGAFMNCEPGKQAAVGIEINANHLRAKRDGMLTAVATPIHKGRTTHVWEVRITDEAGKPVCVSRCTLAIVPAK